MILWDFDLGPTGMAKIREADIFLSNAPPVKSREDRDIQNAVVIKVVPIWAFLQQSLLWK